MVEGVGERFFETVCLESLSRGGGGGGGGFDVGRSGEQFFGIVFLESLSKEKQKKEAAGGS